MQFNYNQFLASYQEISAKQHEAIVNDNIEELQRLIKQKNDLINSVKKDFEQISLSQEDKLKLKELIDQEHRNSLILNQAKQELGKSISKSKKMHTALQGYSKFIR